MKRSLILITLLSVIAMSAPAIVVGARRNIAACSTTSDIQVTAYAEPLAYRAKPTPEIKENDVADADIEEETEVMYYTEGEVIMMAKLLYRECGDIPSDTKKACVAWCVCNRVDSDKFDGDTITYVMTIPHQFAYVDDTPVRDDLYDLSLDVLSRWNAEKNGEVSVGRVLPKDYTYFSWRWC